MCASPGTSVKEFKQIVLQKLREDDDELSHRVTLVELAIAGRLLEDSATLEEAGVSPEAPLMAVFSKRTVTCSRQEEAEHDLRALDEIVLEEMRMTGQPAVLDRNAMYREAIVTIPDGTTAISPWAFEACDLIVALTLPDSLTSIGDGAFALCSSLMTLNIPNSVREIGAEAFRDCSSLTSLTIPDSLTEIKTKAFRGCTSLTSLTIPDSVTEIADEAFLGCKCLTSLTIPCSVEEIGEEAFAGCSSLTSLTISGSATRIQLGAFDGCSSLERLTVPKFVSLEDLFEDWPGMCEVEVLHP